MNASQRTVDLARGIYLRAQFMNLADSDQTDDAYKIRCDWNDWVHFHTVQEYEYVCYEQAGLLDHAIHAD